MPPISPRAIARHVRRQIERKSALHAWRYLGPHGINHALVVTSELCQTVQIIPNGGTETFSPGAAIIAGTPFGGRSRAILNKPGSGAGTSVPLGSDTTAKVITTPQDEIALRVTAFAGGSLTVDVAAFAGSAFTEILHTGLTLSGVAAAITEDGANRQMTVARTVVGLTGVANGSILLHTLNQDPSPWEITIHVIDIDTGTVHSRKFLPGFVPFGDPFRTRGWSIQDDKYYFMFNSPSEKRVQLVTFPPTLTSQTIINDKFYVSAEAEVQFGTLFYADDAINARGKPLQVWDRMPFGGGALTESYVSGVPLDPGSSLTQHPYHLGLDGGKFWVIGEGPPTGGLGPFDRDLKPFFSLGIADVAANGWTAMGPEFGQMYYQFWNGARRAGHDIGAGHIYGFPTARTPGPDAADGSPGFFRLPLTATTWDDASITVMETVDFRPAMVLPDRR